MSGNRIKGQETEIIIIRDGRPVRSLTNIRSMEVTFQQEISSEGYLGQTTNMRDSTYNGVSGSLELHLNDGDFYTFVQAVTDKSQRRVAGVKFNIKCSFRFGDGTRPRLFLPDVEWGEIPIAAGGRSEQVTMRLTYECATHEWAA